MSEQREEGVSLGRWNTLRVTRQVEFGFYMDGGERDGEILLPNGEILPSIDVRPGEELRVLVYLDPRERPVCTTRPALAQAGEFAFLEVAWTNEYGAFLHWGPMKDLLVPFREQRAAMRAGRSYLVHVHVDEESHRLAASAKVEKFLSPDFPPYAEGDEVEALVWQRTDLGLKVIADNRFAGLLYGDQVFRPARPGDRVRAYVTRVRPDGKLDLMLRRPGQEGVTDFSARLLAHLRRNGGSTPHGDKTPPEEIYAVFGVSKKVFKKAAGDLMSRGLAEAGPREVRLLPPRDGETPAAGPARTGEGRDRQA